jgi:GT2 family glycosyltransferase
MSESPFIKPSEVSVVIVTAGRSECIGRCLQCLLDQSAPPLEILIVDSSVDDLTREVCSAFPTVKYMQTGLGFGFMTKARNIGLRNARGRVIAFLDDDAFAEQNWLEQLCEGYDNSLIGAVGGRALNNQPGESTTGVHEVGRLRKDGTLCGFFAADTGESVMVDHIIGCNMSFRRSVLAALGGFCDDFPGRYSLCEDTDMSFRVRGLGYKIKFVPTAVVLHIGAPQDGGKRFDYKWLHYANRNFANLLTRHYGVKSCILANFVVNSTRKQLAELIGRIRNGERQIAGFVRLFMQLSGLVIGVLEGFYRTEVKKVGLVRNDSEGRDLSAWLGSDVCPRSNLQVI